MNTSLFGNTPSVIVSDNRGLPVRELQYYRHPDTPAVTEERITHNQYDERGFLKQSADPRLNVAGLTNIAYRRDLTGRAIQTVSADAGTSLTLGDAAGRSFLMVTSAGTDETVIRTWQYEDAELLGRLLSITEQVAGETARITERFIYAGNTAEEQALNLAGQCVNHYDTAGLVLTDSLALSGAPLSITRRLMKDADNPDTEADWQGQDASVWNEQLDGEAHITLATTDATGAVLTTTDAKANVQHVAYDVAGQLSGNWLTVKNGTEQVIVKSRTYSAAGQKLREEHGNGVVTIYTYEFETQRLTGIRAERPVGHPSGAKVLQDLRYEYDPVGNVLRIRNEAEELRFWRNQKVVPENTYTYDSLYQLVNATGREMANAGQQNSNLPLPTYFDNATYTNYSRTYNYDAAGNLTQIRHSAPASGNSYTSNIVVSNCSNRAVMSALADTPAAVDALFSMRGYQKQLQPGQHLAWTLRGELCQVKCNSGMDDCENYCYDSNSQRILKVSARSQQVQQTLYLPGLELRSTISNDTEIECLQVITIGRAGRSQVRVLHWDKGQPESISNNDQIRWSYDNLIGSSHLEVDGVGKLINLEEYYPYGGTAIWSTNNQTEADYKTIRYSGQERDATGLYYYGYRYYQPWVGRWLSADPVGNINGSNLYCMVHNNPVNSKDIAGLVRADDLPDSILLAIGYKQGPYTEEQNRSYGYRENGQRKLVDRGWVDDRNINTFSPEIFVAAKYANTELLARSEQERAFGNLTVDEMAIIFLYSQESLPFHAWTAYHNIGLPVPEAYRETYHAGQTGELSRALAQLPGFKGMSYRGALLSNTFYAENEGVAQQYQQKNPDATIFRKGSFVTTHGFFSTSRSPEVASQFVFRQRFGNIWSPDTVLFNIIGKSGRNIAKLAELQQAEVLLSPGATFQVTGISRTDFGYHVNLLEVNAEKAWKSGAIIRDYQRGYTRGRRPDTANY